MRYRDACKDLKDRFAQDFDWTKAWWMKRWQTWKSGEVFFCLKAHLLITILSQMSRDSSPIPTHFVFVPNMTFVYVVMTPSGRIPFLLDFQALQSWVDSAIGAPNAVVKCATLGSAGRHLSREANDRRKKDSPSIRGLESERCGDGDCDDVWDVFFFPHDHGVIFWDGMWDRCGFLFEKSLLTGVTTTWYLYFQQDEPLFGKNGSLGPSWLRKFKLHQVTMMKFWKVIL